MYIVHPFPLEGPAAFACAQAGCRACLDDLMRQHEGLVHHILRRQVCGDATYDDLLQEGRIGLWQALLHFDPGREVAFSTYAGVAIQHRVWHAAKPSGLPRSEPPQAASPDARELAEENVWWTDVRTALLEAVSRLPERLRQVVCAAYGLDGAPPCTLDVIGQRFGVTGEMARYWRNNGLVLLRLPAFSARLQQVYGQDNRPAYTRVQALTRAWLRTQRGRR
jgi:RNA polymerase sigma factor (sigma-70 family)